MLDTKAEPAAAHEPHVTAAPPYAKVEPAQELQDVDCEARVETDPGAQTVQLAEAEEAAAKPLGHGAHAVPPAEKVPAAHAAHALEPPVEDHEPSAFFVHVATTGPA